MPTSRRWRLSWCGCRYRLELAEGLLAVAHQAVTPLRHLVPGAGQLHERLGDHEARLLGDRLELRDVGVELAQVLDVGAVVERARAALGRVAEHPQVAPVGGG